MYRSLKRDDYDLVRVVSKPVAARSKGKAGFSKQFAIHKGDDFCKVEWLRANGADVDAADRRRTGVALADHVLWPQPPPTKRRRAG